jgi:hypothetical protein
MVYFQNKKPNLGKFWRVLKSKVLVYFMAILYITWPFGNCVAFWYIFSRFGKLHYEISGNPEFSASPVPIYPNTSFSLMASGYD